MAYREGQEIESQQGNGWLVIAMTDGSQALATTDGSMLAGGGWCEHADRDEGSFEYFGGSNDGAYGLMDLAPWCHRAIDQWGPDGRFPRRPRGLGFDG